MPLQVLSTQYGYDPLDDLTSILDAGGHTTTQLLDSIGRRVSLIQTTCARIMTARHRRLAECQASGDSIPWQTPDRWRWPGQHGGATWRRRA